MDNEKHLLKDALKLTKRFCPTVTRVELEPLFGNRELQAEKVKEGKDHWQVNATDKDGRYVIGTRWINTKAAALDYYTKMFEGCEEIENDSLLASKSETA